MVNERISGTQLSKSTFPQLLLVFTQVLAVVFLIHWFELESSAFALAAILFLLGGVVSRCLPGKFRLEALIFTGVIGTFVVLKVPAALTFLGFSGVYIILCRCKLALPVKTLLLFFFSAGLLFWRAHSAAGGIAFNIVPLIGGVFFFRTIYFLKDIRDTPGLGGWKDAIAYFAILPNLAMFFFPTIGYERFVLASSEESKPEDLENGMRWLFSGLFQLIFYRIIRGAFQTSFEEVQSIGDFFRFLILNLLLYTRISGAFHVVIGGLSLYRVSLPRSNHCYLFSVNFLDVFRRLNIYWKDFMTKVVFYPLYFRLRFLGRKPASITAMAGVFAATCLLHGLLYLWIRGSILIRPSDLIFWGVIGAFCLANMYSELQSGASKREVLEWQSVPAYVLGALLRLLGYAMIWAVWTANSQKDLFSVLFLLRWRGIWDLKWLAVFVTIALLAGIWARIERSPSDFLLWRKRLIRADSLILTALCFAAAWFPYIHLAPRIQQFIQNVRSPVFHTKYEFEVRQRDYYEGLKPQQAIPAEDDSDRPLEEQPYLSLLSDFRRYEWKPNVDLPFNGVRFTTNQWGMADQEHPFEKNAGVARLAFLGACLSMSYGVPPGREWPRLAADLFNADGGKKIELLNFSVTGYSLVKQPYVFQKKVVRFKPDILLVGGNWADYDEIGDNISVALRNGLSIPFPEIYRFAGVGGPDSFMARHYFLEPPDEINESLFHWGLAELHRQAEKQGIPAVFVMTPTVLLIESEAERKVRRLREEEEIRAALENGFDIIDLSQVFGEFSPKQVSLYNNFDGYNNYNVFGHEVLARNFSKHLRVYLKEHPPRGQAVSIIEGGK